MEEKKEKTLKEQLAEDVSIRDSDLSGCMTEQASLYAHYSSLYASAMLNASRAKIKADIARAEAYKRHRNRFIAKGVKFTESMLEAEVMMDSAYQEALELANVLKYQETLCKEGLEAFKHRRDMLVQKGKSALEELKGELFMKSKEDGLDERQARIEAYKRSVMRTGSD